MSRSVVSFFSRVSPPRIIALTLIALGAASCSDSQRFDNPYSNPFSSRRDAPEATGSISSRPMPPAHVASQPLPPPSHPTNVASTGVAAGGHGFGAYRPSAGTEITGSVSERHAASAGHWTWDGGKAITVRQGETIETLARKYGVPAAALMQANGITRASWLRPGQRLVIPRYVAGNTETRPAPSHAAKTADGNVHIVAPGETLIGIARKHGMSLAALARANKINAYTKLNVGDRVVIPGGHPAVAERTTAATAVQAAHAKAEHHMASVETVASVPTQSARLATPEPTGAQSPTKAAEAAGAMPSFRWPVHGRIISAFGAKPNGQQNDGINLAVPEGTPIKAADDGVVAYAGNELKGYGNLVLIRHANGYVSAYANASELLVKRGDKVRRGQVIAHAGQTGNVSSPQLHFEIRKGSVPVDPAKFLTGA